MILIFVHVSVNLGLMTSGAPSNGAMGREGDANNTHEGENDSEYVDKLTGHCNTFRIAIESIPRLFDTIIVSRFPDSLRDRTERYANV